MRHNKIGTLFLVSVLALAGIGISYAGFSDNIAVYGTVDTATVDIDWIGWYSGTWVYKIWGFPDALSSPPGDPVVYNLDDEILIYRGFTNIQPPESVVEDWATYNGGNAELVSYSEAKVGTTHDDETGTPKLYDIDMVYSEIFPCIDFEANFIFHYGGSIPAIIDTAQIFAFPGGSVYPDTTTNFLEWLWAYHLIPDNEAYGAWVEAYFIQGYDETGAPTDDLSKIVSWQLGNPVDVGQQLHACDYVLVKLIIHLPQDNNLQGLSGIFGGNIHVIQWYECTPPPD
jgi:hypothetical protein